MQDGNLFTHQLHNHPQESHYTNPYTLPRQPTPYEYVRLTPDLPLRNRYAYTEVVEPPQSSGRCTRPGCILATLVLVLATLLALLVLHVSQTVAPASTVPPAVARVLEQTGRPSMEAFAMPQSSFSVDYPESDLPAMALSVGRNIENYLLFHPLEMCASALEVGEARRHLVVRETNPADGTHSFLHLVNVHLEGVARASKPRGVRVSGLVAGYTRGHGSAQQHPSSHVQGDKPTTPRDAVYMSHVLARALQTRDVLHTSATTLQPQTTTTLSETSAYCLQMYEELFLGS